METQDAPAPWAMQLAARVEKTDTPTTKEICAAAVLATIGVLEDDRAQPDGSWHAPLDAWQHGGRIRKLVRRTRGAEWGRAQDPGGVTAAVGNAEVRAYVPSPMDEVPAAVSKLQIKSTSLDEPERVEHVPAAVGLLIAVTPMVEMSWGKQAAQCAHAGQLAWRSADAGIVEQWNETNRAIAIVHPTETPWQELVAASDVQVNDGGFTEIPAGTMTAVARWCLPTNAQRDV